MNEERFRQRADEVGIARARKLAAEHNGIDEVQIHLGHDGNMTCFLRFRGGDPYKKEVSGCSGLTLIQAVLQAEIAYLQYRLRERQ